MSSGISIGRIKFFTERAFSYSKFVQLAMVAYVTWKTSGLTVVEGAFWLAVGIIVMIVVGILDWKYVYRDESLASAKYSVDETVRRLNKNKTLDKPLPM